MRALLLAAGLGTRLRPLTDTVPKCLAPIRGRPLLDYWLDATFAAGVDRVLINTHHLADAVRAHIAASPWRARIDLTHEPELIGTGGTVQANRAWFGEGDFLVAHADNLTDVDLAAFIARHAARPADVAITMLAFRTDAPSSCGILELDGDNRVIAFHEKVENPPGDLANAAVYVFAPEVIDTIARFGRPFVDLSLDVMPRYLGRILAVEHRGYLQDIGTPAALTLAQTDFPALR